MKVPIASRFAGKRNVLKLFNEPEMAAVQIDNIGHAKIVLKERRYRPVCSKTEYIDGKLRRSGGLPKTYCVKCETVLCKMRKGAQRLSDWDYFHKQPKLSRR